MNAGTHTHNLSVGTSVTVTLQPNVGGGQALDKTPPLMTFMIYVRL